jgi:hypothetical protein
VLKFKCFISYSFIFIEALVSSRFDQVSRNLITDFLAEKISYMILFYRSCEFHINLFCFFLIVYEALDPPMANGGFL